jgi:erythromycin esterase-like protein
MLATFPLDRAQEVVDGIPEDRRVVLLGESTHGTEEFYRTREAITKRLVEERGFTAVMFEADWPAMQAANEYVHRLRATPYEEDIRFPKWMWHNQCMSDFFEWAKRLEPEQTPQLFGIDCCESEWSPSGRTFSVTEVALTPRACVYCGVRADSLFESKKAVIEFLETHDPEFAAEVRDRLAYLDKFQTAHEYGDAIVHGVQNAPFLEPFIH